MSGAPAAPTGADGELLRSALVWLVEVGSLCGRGWSTQLTG